MTFRQIHQVKRRVLRTVLRAERDVLAAAGVGRKRRSGSSRDRSEAVAPTSPPARRPSQPEPSAAMTKAQLYDLAVERGVPGRSTMTKQQLLRALRAQGHEQA